MSFEVVTLQQSPDLEEQADRLSEEGWPVFLRHGGVGPWDSLFDTFAGFQIFFCVPDGAVVALGHTVPFVWDGTLEDLPSTLKEVMERAVEAHRRARPPNALSALAALVRRDHQRRGLSAEILRTMRALAAERGMHSLVAPVRPTMHSSYPLTPFERYIEWKRDDGAPFDPWLRVHWRLGTQFLKVAPEAMTVTGTMDEWEAWTGMSFPQGGEYIVSGALQPVTIDREANVGHYEDPNVWMQHPVSNG